MLVDTSAIVSGESSIMMYPLCIFIPTKIFMLHDMQIYGLLKSCRVVYSSSYGHIYAWIWSDFIILNVELVCIKKIGGLEALPLS